MTHEPSYAPSGLSLCEFSPQLVQRNDFFCTFVSCPCAAFKTTATGKPLTTFLTQLWFLSSVLCHTNNAIRVLSECFATEITTEGLFTCVNSHMQNELVLLIELLVAFEAFKRSPPLCD